MTETTTKFPTTAAAIDYDPPPATPVTFVPLSARVVILPDPVEEKVGNIWLPDPVKFAKDKRIRWWTGRIVSIGPGMKVRKSKKWKGPTEGPHAWRWPLPDIKVGDRVIYREAAEARINLTDLATGKLVPHVVVRDESIDAVVED